MSLNVTAGNQYEFAIVNPAKAMAAFIACARQRSGSTPVDLSTDVDSSWPLQRKVIKIVSQTANDFNGTGRNPTISVYNTQGFKLDTLWVSYQLPAINARDLNDQYEYDSLPGINSLQQIESTIQNSIAVETVVPTSIIQRYLEGFELDTFYRLARDHWGGYYDPNTGYRGPYQKMTGIDKTTINLSDSSKNEVFPKINILLPIPSCLFFDRELYNFYLLINSPLDFKFIFRGLGTFVSRTYNASLPDLASELSVIHEIVNPVEIGNFYNKAPYTVVRSSDEEPLAPYYIVDKYYEMYTKSYVGNSEYKLNIRPSLVTRLQCFVSPKDFENQAHYFGTTIEMSLNNQLGGMLTTASQNPAYAINLNTGRFVSTNTTTSGNLTILDWVAGGTSFKVKWQRTTNNSTIVTVKCTVPLDSFGPLYLDLATYHPNAGTSGFTSPLQGGIFFFCSELTLDIRAYDANAQHTIDDVEIPTLSSAPMKKLARGHFTFNPDVNNDNQHAFYKVINVKPSSLLTNDQNSTRRGFAFDFFASQPVPQTNTMNPLVYNDTVRLVKNQHYFWDLDCKWPIRAVEFIFEKNSSSTEIYTKDELMIWSDWRHLKQHRWRGVVDFDFNFKNRNKPYQESNGYVDFRTYEVPSYQVKLENVKIQYDGYELTDTAKEYGNPRELVFFSLQHCLRVFACVDGILETVKDPNRIEKFNSTIIKQVLEPNGLTSSSWMDNVRSERTADYPRLTYMQQYPDMMSMNPYKQQPKRDTHYGMGSKRYREGSVSPSREYVAYDGYRNSSIFDAQTSKRTRYQ